MRKQPKSKGEVFCPHRSSDIKPKTSAYGGFEFLDLSVPADGSTYVEGTFAPHLHMKGIRSKRKTIRVIPYANEYFELLVPNGFTLADMKQFADENGQEISDGLQKMLDEEYPYEITPLSYESKIPYLGEYLPIRILPDGDESGGYFRDGAVYLKPGLTGEEIREAVLRLLGEMAYGIFKEKLDRFAKAMNLRYNRLAIDDGRRSFGMYNDVSRDIFLSRRLLMMNDAVIDFLIVHELAHAEEFSHGSEHDALMHSIMPNYDECDDAFHETCSRLIKQGWI